MHDESSHLDNYANATFITNTNEVKDNVSVDIPNVKDISDTNVYDKILNEVDIPMSQLIYCHTIRSVNNPFTSSSLMNSSNQILLVSREQIKVG